MVSEDTSNKQKAINPNRSLMERLQLLTVPITALAIFGKLDDLLSLSNFAEKFIQKWDVWTTYFWNIILNYFNLKDIGVIDGVFFTFLLFLTLSLLTSIRVSNPKFSSKELLKGYIVVFVGFLVLSAIFAAGDIATYNEMVKSGKGHSDYFNSYLFYIYNSYAQLVHSERWIHAGEYYEVLNAILVYGFYISVSIIIFAFIFLTAKFFAVYVQIWRMARRIYAIIALLLMLHGMNFLITKLEISG